MNIFEFVEKNGDAEGFIPSGPPTDEPTKSFDYLSESERMARLNQLRGRLERGEELFHPEEINIIKAPGDGNGAASILPREILRQQEKIKVNDSTWKKYHRKEGNKNSKRRKK